MKKQKDNKAPDLPKMKDETGVDDRLVNDAKRAFLGIHNGTKEVHGKLLDDPVFIRSEQAAKNSHTWTWQDHQRLINHLDELYREIDLSESL